MSRRPIIGPPGCGRGSGGTRMKTLRGPDGGRGRGTAQFKVEMVHPESRTQLAGARQAG
jgi:hypothetical protein